MAGWKAHMRAGPTKSETVCLSWFNDWYEKACATGSRVDVGVPVKNFGIQGDLAAVDYAEVERRVLSNLAEEDRPAPRYTAEDPPLSLGDLVSRKKRRKSKK